MKRYKLYCYIYIHEDGVIKYQCSEPWSDDILTDYTEALKELIEAKEAGHDTAFIVEVEV